MDTGNENACRDALIPFAKSLIGNSNLVFNKAEYTNDVGRVDLILVVEPKETHFDQQLLTTDKTVMVFEMKAPNKFMYEFHSGANRFIPSKDLSLAETQLFSYTRRLDYEKLYLLKKYGADQVKAGGIIIGRKSTMFKISAEDAKAFSAKDLEELKNNTLQSRKRYLYDAAGIVIYNWDHITDLVKS